MVTLGANACNRAYYVQPIFFFFCFFNDTENQMEHLILCPITCLYLQVGGASNNFRTEKVVSKKLIAQPQISMHVIHPYCCQVF